MTQFRRTGLRACFRPCILEFDSAALCNLLCSSTGNSKTAHMAEDSYTARWDAAGQSSAASTSAGSCLSTSSSVQSQLQAQGPSGSQLDCCRHFRAALLQQPCIQSHALATAHETWRASIIDGQSWPSRHVRCR